MQSYKEKVGANAFAGGWEPDAQKAGRLISPGQ